MVEKWKNYYIYQFQETLSRNMDEWTKPIDVKLLETVHEQCFQNALEGILKLVFLILQKIKTEFSFYLIISVKIALL